MPPACPAAFRRSNPARSADVPRWCRYRFVVAIDGVPHPCLDRHRVDATGQPQTRRGVPQVVDRATASSQRRTVQRPLEGARVQLGSGVGDEQQRYARTAPTKARLSQGPRPIAGVPSARLVHEPVISSAVLGAAFEAGVWFGRLVPTQAERYLMNRMTVDEC